MAREPSDRDREVVTHLIESKAVDFEAIGQALAKFGPSAALNWDGEDIFCGTMRRFVNVFRIVDVGSELEQLVALRAASGELQA